jgi:hypothetical protein
VLNSVEAEAQLHQTAEVAVAEARSDGVGERTRQRREAGRSGVHLGWCAQRERPRIVVARPQDLRVGAQGEHVIDDRLDVGEDRVEEISFLLRRHVRAPAAQEIIPADAQVHEIRIGVGGEGVGYELEP